LIKCVYSACNLCEVSRRRGTSATGVVPICWSRTSRRPSCTVLRVLRVGKPKREIATEHVSIIFSIAQIVCLTEVCAFRNLKWIWYHALWYTDRALYSVRTKDL
jgi:hypothetical protein